MWSQPPGHSASDVLIYSYCKPSEKALLIMLINVTWLPIQYLISSHSTVNTVQYAAVTF